MPLLDLLPSRVTLDDTGFDLRWRGKSRRVEWQDVESARVERRLLVETSSGVVEVPRNARGYPALFEALVDRRRLILPSRLEWTSIKTVLSLLGWGTAVTCVGWWVSAISWGLFGTGAFLLALAPFAWERYTASAGSLVRVNLFGQQLFGSGLRGVTWGPYTVLRYPWCHVGTGTWWFSPRGGRAELVAAIIDRPAPDRPITFDFSRPSRVRHPWIAWLFLAPFIATAIEVPITTALAGVAMACFVAFGALGVVMVTLGNLLVHYREDGLWRLTLAGVRFDPSESFVGLRFCRDVFSLVRADGTYVALLAARVPIDWILRSWMPNPVADDHDGYRSIGLGTNARHSHDVSPTNGELYMRGVGDIVVDHRPQVKNVLAVPRSDRRFARARRPEASKLAIV